MKVASNRNVLRHLETPGRIAVLLTCTAIFLACSVCVVHADEIQALEFKIKAACLYNFLKFAHWTESEDYSSSPTITIGIVGVDPFGENFSSVENKLISSKNKTLVIKRFGSFSNDTDLFQCQLVFIASSEELNFKTIIQSIKDRHILTVSDSDSFLEAGGMINLVWVNNQIRWEINRTAVISGGLRLNAQLLRTASRVIESGK